MNLDFESVVSLIEYDCPYTHLAVDQLCDSLILVNEFNAHIGGEYLEYPSKEFHKILDNLNTLIENKSIILRQHPLEEMKIFRPRSMVAFFDVWRDDIDGVR